MASKINQANGSNRGEFKAATPKVAASHLVSSFFFALMFVISFFSAGAAKAQSASVAFVGADTVTEGNWQGVYGADGYVLAQSAQSMPSYASFSVGPHNQWIWASSTSDVRALSVPTGGRIAADWETPQAANASYSLNVNLTDGKAHRVAVYAIDWDQYEGGRTETITVTDANSNAVLDTRTISSFTNGLYLIWNITGSVHINVTLNAGGDAVLSGIFFGGNTPAAAAPAPAPVSTSSSTSSTAAAFVGADTATEGNWQGVYGTDGYVLAQSAQAMPSYAQFSVGQHNQWMWASNTSDVRALSVPTGGRIAADWETPQAANASYSLNVNLTDGKAHRVAVYAIDWDQYEGGRTETITVTDANSNAVLDTRTISSFTNGLYLIWNITGSVHINVTLNAGGDAVLSGIFFGGNTPAAAAPAPAPVSTSSSTSSTAAAFVGADTATEGNWQGVYGTDGYVLAQSAQAMPSYAQFSVGQHNQWMWASNTSDVRALSVPTGGRVAADWETPQATNASYSLNLNLTDGKTHRVAVYALDWDQYEGGRTETITVVNANTNAVLDTRTISSFSNGIYLIWNLSGNVQINVTLDQGGDAVLSGVFVGSGSASANTAAPATTAAPAPAAATAPAASTLILNASASSLSFGSVNVSSSSNQTVTLTNAGTAAVTISNVSLSGAGFNVSGVSVGTILNPGQSATLTATFAPAAAGSSTGSITVTSNATSGANVIALSGTGAAQATHSVNLSWSPSTSSVVGYNVYVSTTSGSGYSKLTGSPVATPDYTDSGLQQTQTRYYVVTSVSSNNVESGYSNEVSVVVP